MNNNLVFINDKVVKKILNSERKECREYLVRIISEVTGIKKDLLRNNIELITNEVSNNAYLVNSTVDSIFKGDNKYFNIEINYNNTPIALVKNNIYVYNMVLRQVKKSKDYNRVSPVIQININNYDKFKENEFVYKSQMLEINTGKIRDEMITIYDINLEFLNSIDYNEIKKGNSYNLEKLLYIFICSNERILDYVYNGDEIMLEIKDEFKSQIKELDEMLYYDPEELKRIGEQQLLEAAIVEAKKEVREEVIQEVREEVIQEVREEVIQEVRENERQNIVKNMIDKGLDDLTIKNILNIDNETLNELKDQINI